MNKIFYEDYVRITGNRDRNILRIIKNLLKYHQLRYLFFLRRKNIISKIFLRRYKLKYGLEIYSDKIGAGLFLRSCIWNNYK